MYPPTLMRGNPPSTNSIRLSLASPLNPPNCRFSQAWQQQQNKGKVTAPISALHYTTSPLPQHRAPTHLPIITCQGKRRAIKRRCTTHWRTTPLTLSPLSSSSSSRRGGTATNKMMMDTRSMRTSSRGAQRRGMAQRLPWQVIIGRLVGARCHGGGLVG